MKRKTSLVPILGASAALAFSVFAISASAHDLRSVNGEVVEHKHYQRSTEYGRTYQEGHGTKNGDIIIWSAPHANRYGSSTRSKHYRGSGFSKPVPEYGRAADRQYGKPKSKSRNRHQ